MTTPALACPLADAAQRKFGRRRGEANVLNVKTNQRGPNRGPPAATVPTAGTQAIGHAWLEIT
jgi:hypothetical protein